MRHDIDIVAHLLKGRAAQHPLGNMAAATQQSTAGPWQTLFQTFVVENADADDTVHGTVQTVLGAMDYSIALLRNRVNLTLKTPDMINSTDRAILDSPAKLLRLAQLLDGAQVPVGNRLAPAAARTNRTGTHAERPRAPSTWCPKPPACKCARGDGREMGGEREEGEDGCTCQHDHEPPLPP